MRSSVSAAAGVVPAAAAPAPVLRPLQILFLAANPVDTQPLQLDEEIRAIDQAPWLMIPGIFVIVAVLAFNFVGDGLRDAADPYSR